MNSNSFRDQRTDNYKILNKATVVLNMRPVESHSEAISVSPVSKFRKVSASTHRNKFILKGVTHFSVCINGGTYLKFNYRVHYKIDLYRRY